MADKRKGASKIAPILAVDVGGGTQDILIWTPGREMENCVQLVLPSPTRIVAGRIRAVTRAGSDLFLHGHLMGGGACAHAVRDHLEAGLRVFAQPRSAATIDDDPGRVEQGGVLLADTAPPGTTPVRTGDLDLPAIARALAPFDIAMPERFAVAVMDHGHAPEESNRRFRFRYWETFLESGGSLGRLAHPSAPERLSRMAAALGPLTDSIVMDTGAAAMTGALFDPAVAAHREEGFTLVNLGNSHTVAALIRGDRVHGIYEHHTGLLDPDRLTDDLQRFRRGALPFETIYEAGGHGCACAPGVAEASQFAFTAVSGPRRAMVRHLGWHPVAPFGNMMLLGCYGLVSAALGTPGRIPGSRP